MATNAISAHGTLVKIGDGGGSEVFTTIAELMDIPGPQMTRTIIDVTSQSAVGWREKIAGLKDPGSLALDMNFVPTDATQSYSAGLIKDFVNGTRRNFQLVFPNGASTTWTLPAIVKSIAPDAPVDGRLALKCELELCSAPTLA